MMYFDFIVGEKTYKLRLTTRNVVSLEKKIGCNPLGIFGSDGESIPQVTTMVAILHASLQALNHGISETDAYDIFDRWLEDGHSTVDFVSIILEIYKVSGIVPTIKDEEDEKN